MKLELKTVNDDSSKSFSPYFFIFAIILFIIIFSSISLKLGNISRDYKVNYLCKLLTIQKSKSNFEKISKITKIKGRSDIWEFCKVLAR